MNVRAFLTSAVITAISAGAALAQGQGPWGGSYVGLSGGIASVDNKITQVEGNEFEKPSYSNTGRGFFGGIFFGHNIQWGSVVAGGEADFSLASVRKKSFEQADPDDGMSSRLDAFSTVRGRLGFAASSSLLVYATGGVALGQFNQIAGDTDPSPSGGKKWDKVDTSGMRDHWKVGWAAGGGVEMMILGNWTVRGEYLHVDFGTALSGNDYNLKDKYSNSGHFGRLAVGYKF
jgi:outer membrane immunogenic protein